MKLTIYEAPVTDRFQIELEGAFMSGSIVKGETSGVETTGQELDVIDGSQWNTDDASQGWE